MSTLQEILVQFQMLDLGEIKFDNVEQEKKFHDDLAASLKDKVDGWVEYLNFLESEMDRANRVSSAFDIKAKGIKKRLSFLKTLAAKILDENGWQHIKGNDNGMKLVTQNRFLQKQHPSEDLLGLFPDLIDVTQPPATFKWKMDELKKAWTQDKETFSKFADMKQIKYVVPETYVPLSLDPQKGDDKSE
jgi:hypothetical protein